MRRVRTISGLIGMALFLAACASTRTVAPSPPPQETTTPATKPAPVKPDVPKPAEPPPRPRPSFDATDFIGLDIATVQNRMGTPDLRQQETFAEVWQYLSGPCVLHLYFYRPKSGPADAPLKVDQALVETRPGPWGDNLNPQGVCGLAFSGRPLAPGRLPPKPAPHSR